MDRIFPAILTITLGLIGVAVLALLVSKQSDTVPVLGASAGALKRMLCTALSPVTGGNCGVTESVTSDITFGDVSRFFPGGSLGGRY